MGRARTNAEALKVEEEIEVAETGDKAVDEFLNGETDEVHEGTEEITVEEAEKLQENAEALKVEEEATYIVEAPNKAYTGTTATVDFKDGKGETSNKVILDYFKAKGYKLIKNNVL